MKNLFYTTYILIFALLVASCTFNGDDGAPGPRGPQGPPGEDGEEAYVFEYTDISFTSPNYEHYLEFPNTFQMRETDKVLIYFLWDYIEEDDLDIWRPLPQTIFTQYGTLLYNYDFSIHDVRLFMDANFNLDFLDADATDNWIVRAVIVPGQQASARNTAPVDYNDYNAVIKYFGLKESNIKKAQNRPQ